MIRWEWRARVAHAQKSLRSATGYRELRIASALDDMFVQTSLRQSDCCATGYSCVIDRPGGHGRAYEVELGVGAQDHQCLSTLLPRERTDMSVAQVQGLGARSEIQVRYNEHCADLIALVPGGRPHLNEREQQASLAAPASHGLTASLAAVPAAHRPQLHRLLAAGCLGCWLHRLLAASAAGCIGCIGCWLHWLLAASAALAVGCCCC